MLISSAIRPQDHSKEYAGLLQEGLSATRWCAIDGTEPRHASLKEYVTLVSRNPDPTSEYARFYETIKTGSDEEVLAALRESGRDIIVYQMGPQPIGHVAFHVKPDEATVGVFSFFIVDQFQGKGLSWYQAVDAIEFGRKIPGIDYVEVGKTGNKTIQHRCDQVATISDSVGLSVESQFRFKYKHRTASQSWRKPTSQEVGAFFASHPEILQRMESPSIPELVQS